MNIQDLNLEKKICIRVLEYDVYLEELHTWAPIMSFMPVKLKFIINFLNRRMQVEFQYKEDELKTLMFVKQYNEIAKDENERLKSGTYPIASGAEDVLMKRLKIRDTVEQKLVNKNNPFITKEYPNVPVNPMKRVSIMKQDPKKIVIKKKKAYEIVDEMTGKENIDVDVRKSSYDDVELTF